MKTITAEFVQGQDAALEALKACEAVLSQLQGNMPLEGIAQSIMAQGYVGSAITKARLAIAEAKP